MKKTLKIVILSIFLAFPFQNKSDQTKPMYDFVASNFQGQEIIVEQQSEEQGVSNQGLFSRIIEKITPTNVKELKKSKDRTNLSPQEQAQLIVTLLYMDNSPEKNIISDDVIRILELVKGHKDQTLNFYSILSQLLDLKTISGKVTTAHYLMNPSSDIHELKARQNSIKALHLDSNLSSIMKEIAQKESSICEILFGKLIDSELENKTIYSQLPVIAHAINKNPVSYNIATIVSTLLPSVKTFALGIYLPVMINNHITLWMAKKCTLPGQDQLEFFQNLSEKQIGDHYTVLQSGSLFDPSTMEQRTHSLNILQSDLMTTYVKKQNKKSLSIVDYATLFKKQFTLFHKASHGVFTGFFGLSTVIPHCWSLFQHITVLSFISKKAKKIQGYLIDVARFIELCELVEQHILEFPTLQHSTFAQSFAQFKENKDIAYLKSLLQKGTFKGNVSTLSNWGNIFVAYQEIEKHKESFIPLLKAIGEFDMYYSIAQFMQQQQMNQKVQFCFAEYVSAQHPIIIASDFWNPLVLTHKKQHDIVTNTVSFGASQGTQNAIITGPNTCGKTTVILALMYNTILAQTWGIAAASEFAFTLFGKMNAILTISTDGSVGDSRFKAEVREAQKVLYDVAKAQKQGVLVFTIQDEIFTGTNAQDGASAAYKFLQKLGAYDNNITLLATHYQELTQLGEPYQNYKIDADVTPDETIIRYFTISKGISTLNVAHIIAREAGL